MSRTASVYGTVEASNIPPDSAPNQPGEWLIQRDPEGGNRRFMFGCPLNPGQQCGVPLKPHTWEANGNVHTWTYDGNASAPTLTPSINCINDPPKSHGCGWHGFVKAGRFTP